ncbi:MAG: type IV pilus assembly protein PilM [Patescibacteria group bacterium]
MATQALQKKLGFIASLVAPLLEFRITGLDISDVSMKYLSFDSTKKNKIIVSAYGEIVYPAGIITNGEVKDEEKLTDILKQWLAKEKKKLPLPFVVLSLPEEKSFIRAAQIPRVKSEDVANAVRWEIENQIPLPFEEIIYDYEVIKSPDDNQDHIDVIITAFPRNILNAYIRAVKGAGLEPYAIELESQSVVRACLPQLNSSEATIVADIGRTRTSFVIFAQGSILHTSTIEMGGSMFEQYIIKQLSIGTKEAAQIKINIGLDKSQRNGEVFTALAPAITIIGDELTRAISYYRTHATHAHGATPQIERILLSGGDANLRGLDTYLTNVLKISVQRADPFSVINEKLAYSIPPLTKQEALAFTTAIGLALREIRQN